MADRTFAKFTFFKLDPAWRRRDAEQRAADKREFLAACEDFALDRSLRAYSTVGTRGDTDLLLLTQSPILEDIHTFHVVLGQSGLAQWATIPHSYLSMTKRSPYSEEEARPEICTSERKYLFVYPFGRSASGTGCRRGAPADHARATSRSAAATPRSRSTPPTRSASTTRSSSSPSRRDDPGEFLDLVQELRGTESSAYTLRDTPIFTCVAMSRAQGARRARRRRRERRRAAARLNPRIAYPSAFAMNATGTTENPLRVAIVGSGPAGFYAAEHCSRTRRRTVEVDMFDRLPTPFGLVRGGVAPDHPKIKSVIRVYEKTAAREGFRFFGNVKLGQRHRASTSSSEHYHAIIYAYGAETDRQLGIPGEDLPGSHAGHRVRRLVQRPPRLRRRRVRPLAASARS